MQRKPAAPHATLLLLLSFILQQRQYLRFHSAGGAMAAETSPVAPLAHPEGEKSQDTSAMTAGVSVKPRTKYP
jgi:hypothetical protein